MSEENPTPDPEGLSARVFAEANAMLDRKLKHLKKELSAAKNASPQSSSNVTSSEVQNNAQERERCKEEIEIAKIRITHAEYDLKKVSDAQLQMAREHILYMKKKLCTLYEKLIELEREHAQKYSIAAICGGIADSLESISDAMA